MLSRSRNILNEQMLSFTEEEAFRAYLQATKNGDTRLAIEILDSLSEAKRRVVDELYSLYMAKLIAMDGYLISRAFLAIGYYNTLLSALLELPVSSGEEGKAFTKTHDDLQNNWHEKVKKIDLDTNGVLDLEEFREMEKSVESIDYWMRVVMIIDGSKKKH